MPRALGLALALLASAGSLLLSLQAVFPRTGILPGGYGTATAGTAAPSSAAPLPETSKTTTSEAPRCPPVAPDGETLATEEKVLSDTLKKVRRRHNSSEAVPSDPPPSECGRRAEFASAGAGPSEPFPDLQIADKVLLKTSRKDLLCETRHALEAIAKSRSMRQNNFCSIFGSCSYPEMIRVSEHSKSYLVCPSWKRGVAKFTRKHANRVVRSGGGVVKPLPGHLEHQGDENVLCRMGKHIVRGVEEQVFPMFKMKPHSCYVQEFFVNRQRAGAWTNPHVHGTFFGAVYYLDAPEAGAQLCYDSNQGHARRLMWQQHYPTFVTDFGDAKHSPGHALVNPGDILLAPVAWLNHWVPPLESLNTTRTSLVFNLLCIKSPPDLKVGGAGLQMPQLGFGTCCSGGEELQRAIAIYLREGGRHLDISPEYNNSKDVARAVFVAFMGKELWVTDKLRHSEMGYAEATEAIPRRLRELKVQQLHMLLLPFPGNRSQNEGAWRALLEAQRAGQVLHVGVSNFNKAQILTLKDATGVLPACNQIEYSPFSPPEVHEFVAWMQGQGIAVTAYGSLGHSGRELNGTAAVDALARKHSKTPAQILLRWAVEKQVAVIPGSMSDAHIEEDVAVQHFRLSPAEVESLQGQKKPASWRWMHAIPGV